MRRPQGDGELTVSMSSPCSDRMAPAECGSTGPGSMRSWWSPCACHTEPRVRSPGATRSTRRPFGQHLILHSVTAQSLPVLSSGRS